MEVIQFATAAQRIAEERNQQQQKMRIPPRPRKTLREDRQEYLDRFNLKVHEADQILRSTGKKNDYIGDLLRLTLHMAEDIIKSKAFDIKDIHTIELDRTTITRIKHLREHAQIIDHACESIHSGSTNSFSANLLFDLSLALNDIADSHILE